MELMTQASSKEMVPKKTRNVQVRKVNGPRANKALSNRGHPWRVYTLVSWSLYGCACNTKNMIFVTTGFLVW